MAAHVEQTGSFLGEFHDKILPVPLPSIAYIPNYISQTTHDDLWEHINNVGPSVWKQLKNRRLQNWGGQPHSKGMLPTVIPDWLSTVMNRLHDENKLFSRRPNHCLINEYTPGQGIMAHTDGPLYEPLVAIISLGSPITMEFSPLRCDGEESPVPSAMQNKKYFSLLLEPKSLLLFTEQAYTSYMHGISEKTVDETRGHENEHWIAQEYLQVGQIERKTRISMTIRVVPKVIHFLTAISSI